MIAGLMSDRGCGGVPPDGTPSHPFSLVLLETDHQCYAVLCNASAAPRRSRSKPQSVARQAAAVRARGDGPRGCFSGELSGLGVQLAQVLGEIIGPGQTSTCLSRTGASSDISKSTPPTATADSDPL